MRISAVLLLLLVCCSCNFFESKDVKKERLVREQIQSIDWNEVDRYPLFSECDENDTKEGQKDCFQSILTRHIREVLSAKNIQVKTALKDTITLVLVIRKDGTIKIESLDKTETINQQIPDIDKIITEALITLPRIYPAIKRGVGVATKVKLPLVLSSD